MTINPALKVDQYPTTEVFFSTLVGEKIFLNHNLLQVYWQVLHDQSSWKYVTINTYKSRIWFLYTQCCKLPHTR